VQTSNKMYNADFLLFYLCAFLSFLILFLLYEKNKILIQKKFN
jgi:hypothetical protein